MITKKEFAKAVKTAKRVFVSTSFMYQRDERVYAQVAKKIALDLYATVGNNVELMTSSEGSMLYISPAV